MAVVRLSSVARRSFLVEYRRHLACSRMWESWGPACSRLVVCSATAGKHEPWSHRRVIVCPRSGGGGGYAGIDARVVQPGGMCASIGGVGGRG